MYCLLRMVLLNLPEDIWTVHRSKPREENQARLAGFLAYYRSPAERKRLRISVLCVQMSMYAANITVKKAKGDDVPVLIRLGKKVVERKTTERFAAVVDLLHVDPEIDQTDAIYAFAVTAIHTIIRFGVYQTYPSRSA